MTSVDTPVISKKQQKKALSAKKNTKKETIKNVLTTPFTRYWPLLVDSDEEKLVVCMENCMPKLSQTRKIPWKEIKDVTKENRKEFRKKYFGDEEVDSSARKHIIFGINAVTRKLEQNAATAVLIYEKISPQFMIKHVINLCVLKRVPVLIVSNLKETLKDKTGLTGACICLTSDISSNDKLKELEDLISTLSKGYPVPHNHINFKDNTRTNTENKNVLEDSDFICIEDTVGSTAPMETTIEESEEEIKMPINGWYLPTTGTSKRAFIPGIHEVNEITGEIRDTADFMSFNESAPLKIDEDDKISKRGRYFVEEPAAKKGKYIPLKVKRIKGNKNRVKEKKYK